MSEKVIDVKGLKVRFETDRGCVYAVNGVDLSLNAGETLGLVGETGAGKTTTALALLRLLEKSTARVESEHMLYCGEEISEMSEEEMRRLRGRDMTMIFQDPMTALNPVQRVGDQIAEVVRLHSDDKSHAAAEKRAKEMLEIVGIPAERYYEYPHQFSGGMKQRVVIAIALACNPDLLLADEPTTALDVTIQAQVLDLIGELRKKYNTAMLLITHDMGVVATTCDNVAVIYAGNIIEYGSKEQIFDHPSHPYTIGLFGAIPSMSEDEEWLHPIDGLPPDPAALPEGCAFHPRCPYATEECRKQPIAMQTTSDGHQCRCCHIQQVAKGE